MAMPKPIKFVIAFVVGFIVWFAVATLLNLVLRATLAGYTQVEPTMQFTLPMLLARLVVGALSSVAAGFACALAARSAPAVKVLAAALVLFFIPVHYSLWAVFPLWYHATFLVSLAPLVLMGAWASRRAMIGNT